MQQFKNDSYCGTAIFTMPGEFTVDVMKLVHIGPLAGDLPKPEPKSQKLVTLEDSVEKLGPPRKAAS